MSDAERIPDLGVFSLTCTERTFTLRVNSSQSNVNRALRALDQFLHEHAVAESSDVKLVLRELLLNAVCHGNHNNSARLILLMVECEEEGTCTVTVEDEGDGFDHRLLDFSLPDDPRQASQRGMKLVNALSESVTFNELGNRVTAVLRRFPAPI